MDELAPLLDHTLLAPDATGRAVEALCDEAREHGFAAVCVNGSRVPLAAARLLGSGVAVAAVVGFPLGASSPRAKAEEARIALEEGAAELDCVVSLGALADGDEAGFVADLAGVVALARPAGALVKAILETARLDEARTIRAAELALAAGVDFVKTSTGFGGGGATPEVVALLRRVVGTRAGVKASGGIRTRAAALALVEAGADRIGSSSSLVLIGAR